MLHYLSLSNLSVGLNVSSKKSLRLLIGYYEGFSSDALKLAEFF